MKKNLRGNQMKKLSNLKCPLCHENTAKQSSAYPDSAVCYCGGDILNEVGTISEGRLIPLAPSINSNTQTLSSTHFTFLKLDNEDDVAHYGLIFENALANRGMAQGFMRRGEIWIAKYNGDENHEYSCMFAISHNEKVFTNCVAKKNATPPENVVEEIKNFLLNNNLADSHSPGYL